MKPKLKITLKILASVGILWLLAHTAKLDFSSLISLYASPSLLLCTVLMFFAMTTVNAWRWYELNEAQAIKMSFSRTLISTYLGTFFNNVLPGGISGDIIRVRTLFINTPDKRSGAVLSVLFDRVTGLLGILLLCLITAIIYLTQNYSRDTFYFLAPILLISIAGLISFFTLMLFSKKLKLSDRLIKRFEGKKWIEPFISLINAMRIYRNAKMVIVKCLIASIIVQLMIVITCALIARMLNFPSISFCIYSVANAVTQIANLIPITPGGLGVGEIAFSKVITSLNFVILPYATIYLTFRILSVLTNLPGIFVFVFGNNLTVKHSIFKKETAY